MGKINKHKIEIIIPFGNPHLRAKCKKIEVFHKGLHNKIDIIANTLKQHGGGAALAAPQISLLKRIIVVNYLDKYFELINPETIDASGEIIGHEGCLSLPGFTGCVKRYQKLRVKYQDRMGEFHINVVEDEMARCFQHEMDHLEGILYIDRMTDEYVFNDDTDEKLSVEYLLELTKEKHSSW